MVTLHLPMIPDDIPYYIFDIDDDVRNDDDDDDQPTIHSIHGETFPLGEWYVVREGLSLPTTYPSPVHVWKRRRSGQVRQAGVLGGGKR